mgnify:CR=1 FL=1
MRATIFFSLILILQGCLQNNDDEIKLGFLKDKYQVTEPLNGATELVIPIEIFNNDFNEKTIAVSIKHIESDLLDVDLIQNEFVISQKNTNIDLTLHIKSDIYYEELESFELILSVLDEDDVEYTLQKTSVTITSSNPEPEVGFEVSKVIFSEGTGNQRIRAIVSNPFQHKGITVTFSHIGSAKLDTEEFRGDYKLSSSEFNILPGELYSEIIYESISDGLKEGGESIILALNTPSSGELSETNTLKILIPGEYIENDTGVTLFANPSGLSVSPSNAYPSQDAHNGLDIKLNSQSDGLNGFSFTKIDQAGNAISYDNPNFLCVMDENTGLTWEVKGPLESLPSAPLGETLNDYILELKQASVADQSTPEYSPYPYYSQHSNWTSASYSYYWFNDTAQTNGGSQGADGPYMDVPDFPIQATCAYPDKSKSSFSPSNKNCNIKQYVNFKNSIASCGYKNWKVPSLAQLRTIINYNPDASPFDPTFFPYLTTGKYLTLTPSADVAGSAWCFDTSDKKAKLCNKQLPNKILLVRSVK